MNKSKKAVAIVVAALCMGLMITGCGKQEGSLQESASQMSSEPESSHKSIQEELAEQYGVSTQAIQNIYDACAAVGMVTENMEFTTTETLENGNKSFTIIYEENEFKAYLYPDETVCEVDSGNNEIVFYQDGTVWEQVEDRIVTIAQKETLMEQSQEVVKEYLFYPETAVFSSDRKDWTITTSGTSYQVIGHVNCNDDAGNQATSEFDLTYMWDGSEDTKPIATSVMIDGQKME
ncbi:hypothetical protein [Clostridium facile]|uniref:Uncharacterized protein n=1 Tax=Clostridium facile TaxID=2763035 RepID=A0ABR7IQK1_9CLOT|nr:hypothetical protein [Clostridium facile]MBC5787122.1 hypothetical protein [Clostridium facile]